MRSIFAPHQSARADSYPLAVPEKTLRAFVVADCVSFALAHARELIYFVAPPLQIRPASLGSDLGLDGGGRLILAFFDRCAIRASLFPPPAALGADAPAHSNSTPSFPIRGKA